MNKIRLKVLLVEDDSDDLKQFKRDLPDIFDDNDVDVELDPCSDFDEAFQKSASSLLRYDLIVSDVYKGSPEKKDAAAIRIVEEYKSSGRFCPIVIFSSFTCPAGLKTGPFVKWADKGKSGDIERAIKEILQTNVPQAARRLHDDIDQAAGSFLWAFLEDNWDRMNDGKLLDKDTIDRIIRRRAALQIGDFEPCRDQIIPL